MLISLAPGNLKFILREVVFWDSNSFNLIVQRLYSNADFISCGPMFRFESEDGNWVINFIDYMTLFWIELVLFTDLKEDTCRLINIGIAPIITPSAFYFHHKTHFSNAMLYMIISEEIVFSAEFLTALELALLFRVLLVE